MQQLLTDRRRTRTLKVDHTAQGSGQRHTCLQQICQLPRVICQFLQLELGLTAPTRSVLSKRRLRRGPASRELPPVMETETIPAPRFGSLPHYDRPPQPCRAIAVRLRRGLCFENWHYFMTPAGFKLPRR